MRRERGHPNRQRVRSVQRGMGGTLSFDVKDALRGLRRDRAFSTTVLVTLALTLGATTAVFSIVNGILLKPLSYPAPERLVTLHETWRELADRLPRVPVNERHFEHWRTHATSFSAMAQYLPLPANLILGGDATQISVARTSASVFDVLGVSPVLGRPLVPSDEAPGAEDVAVVSHAFSRTRFGAERAALGQVITLDGTPFTVVGVLPPDFRLPAGEQLIDTVDAFIPLRVNVGWVGEHNNFAIARLRDDVTADDAAAELRVLQAQISEIATKESGEPTTLGITITPLTDSIVGRSRRGLVLLLGAMLAVLLIACANLANLTLARTLARMRDGAIRAALGASRGRLVRQVIVEQLLFSLLGTAAGVWVASIALDVFVQTAPIDLPRVHDVTLDGTVLLFAFGLALLSGLLVASLPAWHLASGDVQAVLRAGGTVVGADRAGLRSRRALLALQVAMSVALLAVTGLLGLSLMRVLQVDRGFTAERILALPVALPAGRYNTERLRIDVYDRMLNDIRALPGVSHATLTSLLPMRGEGQVNFIVPDDKPVPRSEQPSANFRFVGPEYFDTLQLRLTSGRTFTDSERHPDRAAPAVISESVARRLWPGEDAIGKGFSRGITGEQAFVVVGIAADARTTSIEREPPLMVYVPYWWRSRIATSLLVRSAQEPTALVPEVRRVLRQTDPEIAVGQARALAELVRAATAVRRYQSQLFIAFGIVALFIATLGVYAVTSYTVSRRRREMNIRVALGAKTAEVIALVMRETSTPILVGIAFGATLALAIGGVIGSLLYDVNARDPLVLFSVAVVMGAAGLIAAWSATRRGMAINPVAALREE